MREPEDGGEACRESGYLRKALARAEACGLRYKANRFFVML